MSADFEKFSERLHYLFCAGSYQQALSFLDEEPLPACSVQRATRRRLEAWIRLARGETETAYNLFWSCAQEEGARAGILVLTVLAGQVGTAITHWQRHLQSRKGPVLSLPDADWHAPLVTQAALRLLADYPLPERSAARGASHLYQALLSRAIDDAPAAFFALSEVVDFYPAARLLRDHWLDETVCLPAPRGFNPDSAPGVRPVPTSKEGPGTTSELGGTTARQVVDRAARLLLYPDIPTLERQCRLALDECKWLDALEILRRLLFLDPEHVPSLEKRWRVHLQLGSRKEAREDLFTLVELYEKNGQVRACCQAAEKVIELFPHDERALLRMCFLQARLDSPLSLAQYGRRLLDLCRQENLLDRRESYRGWLLRQNLSLDDQLDIRTR